MLNCFFKLFLWAEYLFLKLLVDPMYGLFPLLVVRVPYTLETVDNCHVLGIGLSLCNYSLVVGYAALG